MAPPSGFTYTVRKNGDVVILHQGVVAAVLRGTRAARFIEDDDGDQDQDLMARITGNYKRGNERLAAEHPRNQR